ncbi:MAG: hypothetical protein ACRC68_17025 [Clostridium sp.]
MKDFDEVLEKINNITIDELPNISITEIQKNKARDKIFTIIKELKERNNKFSINICNAEIIDISNGLGDDLDKYLDGVKHGRLLRAVALKSVNNEVVNKYKEIVGEAFAKNGYIYKESMTGWKHDETMYYKIYITKDTLIVYGFTETYKIVDKIEVSIKDIKSAGLYKENKYHIEFSNRIIYLAHTQTKVKRELEELINILQSSGTKNNIFKIF